MPKNGQVISLASSAFIACWLQYILHSAYSEKDST